MLSCSMGPEMVEKKVKYTSGGIDQVGSVSALMFDVITRIR